MHASFMVDLSVTKFQPHHTHMQLSQGLNITDVCIIIKEMSIKDKNASLLPVLRALLGKNFCIGQCPRNFVFFIAEKMSQ